jgi:NAD(P)-dependent dehydrogenase (short-subunit alcohol dehydrogenase family)
MTDATDATDASRFGGRTAIVTGAASGIGRATALRLAADGAAVGCLDVADAVDDTVARILDAGGKAVAARVDVRDETSVAGAVAAVERALGPTRILANVAGVLRFAITHEATVADWDLMIDVNLKGPFLLCRAVIPSMLANGGGAIVNVSSSAGMFGQAYNAGYCASKAGVAMMTRSIAWEYVKQGIRANAISPGGVDTSMTAAVDFPEGMDWKLMRKNMAPENQMMSPDLPAGLIAFLASDEASAITGAVVPIDHGITC